MFFRLLKGSLLRRASSTLLALGAVWIGLTLVVALLTLVITVGDQLNRELSALGANIRVEPVQNALTREIAEGQSYFSTDSYLREGDIVRLKTDIFWRNNILELSPRLTVKVQAQNHSIPLSGYWIDYRIRQEKNREFVTGANHLYKHWVVEGRWPKSDRWECMVGEKVARKLNIKRGESISLAMGPEKKDWKVVGIFSSESREDNSLVAELGQVQKFAHLPHRVSFVEISALTTPEKKIAVKFREDPTSLTPQEYERWVCTPFPGTIAAQVQKNIPHSSALVVRRVSATQGVVLDKIRGLTYALATIAFIVSCLSVMGVLTLEVFERKPEVALLQAMGAKRGSILFLFFTESTLVGLVGGLLAAASGVWLGQWLVIQIFGQMAAEIPLGPVLLSPLIGVVLAGVGTLWPVWQVFQCDTADVLHGCEH